MPLTIKNRTAMWIDAAGILCCLALTALGYYLGISPLLTQRERAESERQQLVAKQSQSSKVKALINELNTELATVREKLASTNVQLLRAEMVNSRVAELASLFTEHSLAVDDVKIGTGNRLAYCETVPIQISGRGGYAQCTLLLHNLCDKFPDVHVAGVDLTGSQAGQQKEQTFRLDLVWYASLG